MLGKLALALTFVASLTLAAPSFAASKGSVLVIMSGTRELPLKDGKTYDNAGVYLGEVSAPVKALIAAGYTPVFASPDGVTPTIDPFSEQDFFFKGGSAEAAADKALVEGLEGFKKPHKLADIADEGTAKFVGVFVPGGFAPMGDLMTDKNVGRILREFHDNGRPIAMVCHGPVALIATLPEAEAFKAALIADDFKKANDFAAGWPFAGYRMTIFSSGEEPLARGPLKGEPQLFVSDAVAQAGGHVDRLAQNASNVIVDRELITGQNPFSADAIAAEFVKRLDELSN